MNRILRGIIFLIWICIVPVSAIALTPAVNHVPTMAALQALNVAAMAQYDSISLDGYHAGNPAGAGIFNWIPAPQAVGLVPDGGTIIAPSDNPGDCTLGCLKRAFNGVYQPEFYGAYGDAASFSDATIGGGALSTLTSASTIFTPGDVGKIISINGAGAAGVTLVTTISAYIDTHDVTIAVAASQAVTNVQAWYGHNDRDAANSALTPAGAGGSILFANSYAVSGTTTPGSPCTPVGSTGNCPVYTLRKLVGQTIFGNGWTNTNAQYPLGSTIVQMDPFADTSLIATFAADGTDNTNATRGGVHDLVLIGVGENGGYSTAGIGFNGENARMQQLYRNYVTGFNIDVKQGYNSWQWDVQDNDILNCAAFGWLEDGTYGEADDSRYIGNNINCFSSTAVGRKIVNFSQTNTDIGNQYKANGTAIWLAQGADNNVPLPMEATMVNPIFEDSSYQDILITASVQNAPNSQHPNLNILGGRSYNGGSFFGSPRNGTQAFICAEHTASISVVNHVTSYLGFGALVGQQCPMSGDTWSGSAVGQTHFDNDLSSIYTFETALVTGTVTGSVMNVTAVTSGTLHVNDWVNVCLNTSSPATLQIASFGTGSGGTGTYNLTGSINCTSTSIPAVSPNNNSNRQIAGSVASVANSYVTPGNHQLFQLSASTTITTPVGGSATLPFDTVILDKYGAYTGSFTVTPPRIGQLEHFHVQQAFNSAPAGRYVLEIVKNGATIFTAVDVTMTATAPLLLSGEVYDTVSSGATYQAVINSSVAATTVNDPNRTYFYGELAGN